MFQLQPSCYPHLDFRAVFSALVENGHANLIGLKSLRTKWAMSTLTLKGRGIERPSGEVLRQWSHVGVVAYGWHSQLDALAFLLVHSLIGGKSLLHSDVL